MLPGNRYAVRLAENDEDVRAAQRLRYLRFIRGKADPANDAHARGLDIDEMDQGCEHVLVEDRRDGGLAACFRLLKLDNGAQIDVSYAAKYYDLMSLRDYPKPMIEIGRFCARPGLRDPDAIRSAWAAVARFAREGRVGMLFGCSSFQGVDAKAHEDAFALLKDKHLGPIRWLPRVKAPNVFRFGAKPRRTVLDVKRALRRMPPLLRSYLRMGGWVSDHAVIDMDLNTLHVFTGVEVGAVPASRVKTLGGA